jgi:hypothetical protein
VFRGQLPSNGVSIHVTICTCLSLNLEVNLLCPIIDDGDTSGSPAPLAANGSGRAGLKVGADVAIGERATRRKNHRAREKKTSQAQPLEEEERGYTVRLFGTNSPKEGAV